MEQHQILHSLKSIFRGFRGSRTSEYSSSATIGNHNIFGKYLELILEPETKQFPVFRSFEIIQELRQPSNFPCRLVIPLNTTDIIGRKRSYGVLIRDCFERHIGNSVYKCVTTNDIVYYGAPGILLDADFNPLFIAFYDIEPINFFENRFKISGITIKISPKVFLETSKLLEKSIVNKIIPLYLSGSINIDNRHNFEGGTFFPKIIIEDLSSYIKSPSEPQSYEHTDEDLNNFLASRIDEDVTNFSR